MLIELTKEEATAISIAVSHELHSTDSDHSAKYAATLEELRHKFAGYSLEVRCKHNLVDKVVVCEECRKVISHEE